MMEPVVLGENDPLLCATETAGWKTVKVPAALTAACAALFSQKKAATASSKTTSRTMIKR